MSVLVTIIQPLYNSELYIDSSIESVLNQGFSSWELILVDDCSTDNSLQLAIDFSKKDSRIRVLSLSENSGAAVARNRAIQEARGRFIAFLDSDDIWLRDKLEIQVEFMQKNKIPFCYASYEKINEVGTVIGLIDVPKKVNYKGLLKTCVIGCLTAVYDTEYFGKVEMPLIRKRQDFGLWLRLLSRVDYAYGVQKPLAQYRVRKDSISANKMSAATYTWRLYREVQKLSLLKSVYYFSHYSVRGLLRTKFPRMARVLGWL